MTPSLITIAFVVAGWSIFAKRLQRFFGLLAFNALDAERADATVMTVVLVVLGSILIHGAGSPAVARMHLRSEGRQCTS